MIHVRPITLLLLTHKITLNRQWYSDIGINEQLMYYNIVITKKIKSSHYSQTLNDAWVTLEQVAVTEKGLQGPVYTSIEPEFCYLYGKQFNFFDSDMNHSYHRGLSLFHLNNEHNYLYYSYYVENEFNHDEWKYMGQSYPLKNMNLYDWPEYLSKKDVFTLRVTKSL